MGLETRGQVEMEHEKTGSPCKVGASGVLLPCPQARQLLPVETQQGSKESWIVDSRERALEEAIQRLVVFKLTNALIFSSVS